MDADGTKTRTFIGKESDAESNLGDFGARKYDSRIGRFTSVDALWMIQPEYTPYHYSANDPVNKMDPSGYRMLELNGAAFKMADMYSEHGSVCNVCGRVHDERGGCIPRSKEGSSGNPPKKTTPTPSKPPSKPLPPLGNPFSFGSLPVSHGGSQPPSGSGYGSKGGGVGTPSSGEYASNNSNIPSSNPTSNPAETKKENSSTNTQLGQSVNGRGNTSPEYDIRLLAPGESVLWTGRAVCGDGIGCELVNQDGLVIRELDATVNGTTPTYDAARILFSVQYQTFTKSNYAWNKLIWSQIQTNNGMIAHHVFPQGLREQFRNNYGINVDEPWFITWLPSNVHRGYDANHRAYNAEWAKWIGDNENATWHQVLQQGAYLMNKYFQTAPDGYVRIRYYEPYSPLAGYSYWYITTIPSTYYWKFYAY
jgi:RHS repeat-associated protein